MYLNTCNIIKENDFIYKNAKALIKEHLVSEIREKMSDYGDSQEAPLDDTVDDNLDNIRIYTVSAKVYLQLISQENQNENAQIFSDIQHERSYS